MFLKNILFFLIMKFIFYQNYTQALKQTLSHFYHKKQFNYGTNYRLIYKKQFNYINYVQDHHCIPKQHKDHVLLKKMNYDIHNYDNIVIMPNKKGIKQLNLHPDTLVHDGGHRNFNKYVKKQLDFIHDTYDDMDSYRYQFWLLLHHIKKNMRFNEDKLPWK